MILLLGALAVALAAFLGGVVGFAYGLVSLPLLLLLGVPLAEVVVINLLVALITRVVVVVRRHKDLNRKRAGLLIIGSPPGIGLGILLRDVIDSDTIKLSAGILALIGVVALISMQRQSAFGPEARRGGSLVFVVGGLGGFLGVTTSLNGIAPALLLAGSRATARSFVADLATFVVVSNLLTLAVLPITGHWPSSDNVWPMLGVWLPAGLVGNQAGVSLGPMLPHLLFRRLTLLLIFVSGALSILEVL